MRSVYFMRLTGEVGGLVFPGKVMEQSPGQELGAFGLNLDVILVHCNPRVKLHSVEVSEEVDVPPFGAISGSCDRL